MIRNFFRHVLESFKSLKRNGWMTVASTSAVTITLILVGVFLAVIQNTTKLTTDIANSVTVTVFVDVGYDDNSKHVKDSEGKEVENGNYHKLYKELKKLNNVEDVTFSSKEMQLKKIVDVMGPSFKLFSGDANPLYDVYEVSASKPKLVKSVAKAAGKLDHVYRADYGGTNSDKVLKISNGVKTWGSFATILLLAVAMLLISNTIRITILSRQREIAIMRLVGAKNGYIRWPFFFEGAWIGVIGAIIPSVLVIWLYRIVYAGINPQMVQSHLSLIPPNQFIFQVVVLMFSVGVVIGSLGSVLSMRKSLKV
ncbi:MAG: permease-like cell division protein FtsX [Streptococcaceae bacterium]|jgi:cell division transport system permease protein|nr:permease-like cell division protein FtsX [Streptococcaceae bacterium]